MSPTALIPLLLIAVIGTYVAIRWRHALVMALPFLAVLNGLPLNIGGSSTRVDQLAACLLMIPLVAGLLSGRRRFVSDGVTWCLAALLCANIVASVLNSPARGYSLLQCMNLASAWAIYVVVLNFVDTREALDMLLERCLMAAVAVTSIGIGAFALAVAGVRVSGAEVSRSAAAELTRPFGAYATMVEPNIFGSFSCAMLVLSAGVLMLVPRFEATPRVIRLARWCAALSTLALVLSFTRSAWIGAAAGLIVLVVLGRHVVELRVARFLMPIGGVAVAGMALLLLPGTAGAFFRFKLANLVNLESPTATLRLLTYGLALDQTRAHPLIGYGTFSFAPLVAQGADFAQYTGWRAIWITNFLLLGLHDTGVIGLALWITLLALLLLRGARAARDLALISPGSAARAAAFTAMIASLLLPFLATTGFSLGYPWLLCGLLGAHLRVARQDLAHR